MSGSVSGWRVGHARPHSRAGGCQLHGGRMRGGQRARPAPRAAQRRHVPAGLQERLGGREDLGERGVAGDGHRVVEAELSPEPPTRNTRHVSDSGARTSLAVGVSGAPADDPGTTRGRLRAQTSPPKAQRHTQRAAVCRRARCSSRHALVSGQGQRSTQTPHGDPVQATVRKRHGARRRWTCRAPVWSPSSLHRPSLLVLTNHEPHWLCLSSLG